MMTAVLAAVISLASLAVTLTISGKLDALTDDTELLDSKLSRLSETEKSAETLFMLKEYNGVIGVFDDAGVLTDIIDVDIKSLPEADRAMLGAGIYALSRRELAALIEDYTG